MRDTDPPEAGASVSPVAAAAPRLGRLLPLFLSALVVLGGITAAYTVVQLYGPEQLVGGAQAPQLFSQFTGVALCVAVGFGVAALLVGFLAPSRAGTGRTRAARRSVPAEQAPTTTHA